MAVLTTYTSYDEIRAVLGVSTEELEDSTLSLGMYAAALTAELEDINTGIPAQFITVAGMADIARTANQQRFFDSTRLFAAYAIAKQLGSSLPLFSPKDITDGKASVARFADSPYQTTLKEIKNMYEAARLRLGKAYDNLQSLSTSSTPVMFLSAVAPAIDPVTGT